RPERKCDVRIPPATVPATAHHGTYQRHNGRNGPMTVYTTLDSPLGELLLVGEKSATAPGGTALASLSLPGQKGGATVQDDWTHDADAFTEIAAQLGAYFAGERTGFDIAYV